MIAAVLLVAVSSFCFVVFFFVFFVVVVFCFLNCGEYVIVCYCLYMSVMQFMTQFLSHKIKHTTKMSLYAIVYTCLSCRLRSKLSCVFTTWPRSYGFWIYIYLSNSAYYHQSEFNSDTIFLSIQASTRGLIVVTISNLYDYSRSVYS
jgi:hypothetical protein